MTETQNHLGMNSIFGKFAQICLIIIGILAAGLGLKGFLIPNHFIDGGVTGTSMFASLQTGIPLALLLLVINTPFVILGWRTIGKQFSITSALAILGLSLCVFTIDYPLVTNDKLLASVFGGFFLGAGIGLAIRGGAVLDGTEVLALLVSRKTGLTVGDFIFIFNVALFSIAAFSLGIETALYSMLTYFTASKTVDFLIHGIEEYNGIMIVSEKSSEIRSRIIEELSRGATIFEGRGGKSNLPQDILFCVVTRFEVPKVKLLVQDIDDRAFIVVQHVSSTSGGIIKNPITSVFKVIK